MNGGSDYIAFYGIFSKIDLSYYRNRRGNMINVKPCGDNTFRISWNHSIKKRGKEKELYAKDFLQKTKQ